MKRIEAVNKLGLLLSMSLLSVVMVGCSSSDGQSPILGTSVVASVPRVILTTPAKLFPVASDIATNVILTAKFSHDMDAATITTGSFKVACPAGTPVTATVTYNAANRMAVLQHVTAFPISTLCVATITTAAKDTAGVALAQDHVWTFNTGTTTDTAAPAISLTNPLDTDTGVCLSKSVNVTFDESIDLTTLIAANFFVSNSASVHMPGTISYDGLSKTASFAVTNPTGYVATNVYTVHVTTGVKDLAGNPFASEQTFSFTTGTAACDVPLSISLGTAANFGTFGGGAGATNSGTHTIVNGDMGTTAVCTAFTGYHDHNNAYRETGSNVGEVTGDIYCAPPAPGTDGQLIIARQAAADALAAYNALAAITPSTIVGTAGGDLVGLTLLPDTYTPTPATFKVSAGVLTLDAAGDAGAIWVFQVPAGLTIDVGASVVLINGAQAKNVYWQVGSAARLENGTTMVGTIIALDGVTISTAGEPDQTTLTGRAIGLNASVTMVNTTIIAP